MKQFIQKRKIFFHRLCLIFLLVGLISCDPQLDVWNETVQNTASVNFYALSETFPHYIGGSGIGIFVDTTEYQMSFGSLSTAPFFYFSTPPKRESWFPYNNRASLNNQPLYMAYNGGSHRFYFSYLGTSIPYRLAENTFDFDAGSSYTLYFIDDAVEEGAEAAYRVLQVPNPEQQSISEGKVSVRFLHLGMDAGKIDIRLLQQDNSESEAVLPQNFSFTDVSDYVAIDTADVQRDGILIFHIYTEGSNIPLIASVPAEPEHSFDILLHGFIQPHTRQVITEAEEDGTLTFKTVELSVGFTATLRRMY